MDIKKVGEKLLSSVRSFNFLSAPSDRPEVPARVAAATAVARAVAGLPRHQRLALSSSSSGLVSPYASVFHGQTVERPEEEFYEEVQIWEDKNMIPLTTLVPHERLPVSSVALLTAPSRSDHVVLLTAILETLMALLDSWSIRKANLLASLRSCETLLCKEMQKFKAWRDPNISINGLQSCDREFMSASAESPLASIIENNQNSEASETQNDSCDSHGTIFVEFGRTEMEKQHEWNRRRAFDKWVWSSFFQTLHVLKYNPDMLVYCESCHDLHWPEEGHCKHCHTTFELDFDSEERYAIHVKKCNMSMQSEWIQRHKVLSSRLQSLKAGMHAIEAVLPEEALEVSWKRSGEKVWIKRLRRASSPVELAQVLADLENAIRDDWLHSCSSSLQSKSTCREMIIPFFLGSPQTISSMAFWLVRLDSIISVNQEKICRRDKHKRKLTSKGKRAIL